MDFYVKKLGLVIEIDGTSHNDKDTYDAERTIFLESLGLKVYRIDAPLVLHDLDNVMRNLELYIIQEFGA